MANNRVAAALAFDVYGTLIDPFHMEDHLRAAFGERAREASELWRSKQLEYSFRRALMKKYRNFDVCTAQALHFVSEQMGVPLADKTLRELLAQYLKLPAYPDVPETLTRLAERGFKLVACSNGTENALQGLLEHAGVLSRFSGIVSVDRIPHIQTRSSGVRISCSPNARFKGNGVADIEQPVRRDWREGLRVADGLGAARFETGV